jgi:glycosyltransferase involved in cell wall biosynthesis
MNILFLSESFYPHGSGGELATYLYAKLLTRAGFKVIVITNQYLGEPKVSVDKYMIIYRIPLYEEGGDSKYSILARLDILFSNFFRNAIKWADIVYIPGFWYSTIPLAKAYGKPVLVHLHGYNYVCPLAHLYDSRTGTICDHNRKMCSPKCIYKYERFQGKNLIRSAGSVLLNSTIWRLSKKVAAMSDAFICVSKAQRDIIGRYDSPLIRKAHVIYNPLPEIPMMKVEGDGFGYFGGPDSVKGFKILYKAMKHLAAKGTGTFTLHATAFPREETRTVGNSNIFYYKRLNAEGCQEIYRQIKAVVFPSIVAEPWGYVASEALLRGRVLIASRLGGIPEQTKDCKGVFLYDPRDHKRLADILQEVNALSKESIEYLGLHNREVFTHNYSNEKTIRAFTDLCAEVCSQTYAAY